jgi:hypothetical protein
MANTIAHCEGSDKTRDKSASRLGSESATGRADTWSTFTTCHVTKDGSGYVSVVRNGKTIHHFWFGPEYQED